MKTSQTAIAQLQEVEGDLSRYLRRAQKKPVVITQGGKPAGVLIGFSDDDDYFDWKLENDPRFLARIAQARASARAGKVRSRTTSGEYRWSFDSGFGSCATGPQAQTEC